MDMTTRPKSLTTSRGNFGTKELSAEARMTQVAESTRLTVADNVSLALESPYVRGKKGIFGEENYMSYFSLAGAIRLSSLKMLRGSQSYFTNRQRPRMFERFSKQGDTYILRGPGYLMALDPHLSLLEKLDIYVSDVTEAAKVLKDTFDGVQKQHFEIAPVLDYMKNALITVFNAYTNREKHGDLNLTNDHYQQNKKKLLALASQSTLYFYLSLVGDLNRSHVSELCRHLDEGALQSATETIKKEFRDYKFSSLNVVRPEASHPLVLAGFAWLMWKKYCEVKYIFGMPSGGTELACLVKEFFNYSGAEDVELVLLPISLHSIKLSGHTAPQSIKHLKKLVPKKKLEILRDKQPIYALIVDDNSATGQTMQKAREVVTRANKSITVCCAVAEADIVRAAQKIKGGNRHTKVANPVLYAHAINILPVSSLIMPKHDLKEVVEIRLLTHDYRAQTKSPEVSIGDVIYHNVIADSIEYKYDHEAVSKNPSVIHTFKDSFLSNFYSVNVSYKKRHYPSVEHAYLRQKFDLVQLKTLDHAKVEQLNDIFKFKGLSLQLTDFSDIFYNDKITANTIKRISVKLKAWGYERPDWDSIRLKTMIDLQIKKYAHNELRQMLLNTGDKLLIEGNDWNDTYWGVSNERGHNYLGRILMELRKLIKEL